MTKLTRKDVEQIIEEAREKGQTPNLTWVNLNGTILSGAILSRMDLSGADLNGVYLSGADLRGVNLSQADLNHADLSRANLIGVNLSRANLSRTDLRWGDFRWADLRWAKLIGARLSAANLGHADLRETNLSKVNFSETILGAANLSGADLTGADLRWADLTETDVTRANFNGVTINRTIFVDVDLGSVKGLSTMKHSGPSIIDINTIHKSKDKIPATFLEQAGVHPDIIRWQHSLHTRPTVFISYNHDDEKEKDQLLRHLEILQTIDLIDIWHDEKIGAGDEWKKEIEQTLAKASVAILLISANFLTSDFINTQEIPALLQRRKNKKDLVIFPIIAKACPWQSVGWLADMQVRPKGGQPIWSRDTDIDGELTKIADEVTEIVKNLWFSKKSKK